MEQRPPPPGHDRTAALKTPEPLRELARRTVHVDRSLVSFSDGVRCTLGLLTPIVIGLAVHRPVDGAVAAVGALCAGYASVQGMNRARLRSVLAATFGMGLATLTGALAGNNVFVVVPLTIAWGFAAGWSVCLGPAATVVALQTVVALLIVGTFHATLTQAVVRAALVIGGGLVQEVLLALALVVSLALPRTWYADERRAVGAALSSLARYAAALPPGPPEAVTLSVVRAALADPQLFGGEEELAAFLRMADEADRIRLCLLALSRLRQRLPAAKVALGEVGAATADLLSRIAEAVSTAQPLVPDPASWELLGAAEAALRTRAQSPSSVAFDDAADRTRALAGQLRTVARLVVVVQGSPHPELARVVGGLRAVQGVRGFRGGSVWATLQANRTMRSSAFRHGLRLGVVLGVAVVLYRVLPIPRGYWLPVTALVVLKPDFGTTVSRGVARVGGTLLGAGVATVIAAVLRPGPVALTALLAVFALAGYTIFRANYALFSVCVTGLLVFLLAFTGLPEPTAVLDRSIDTVLGGALALAAYAAWPTWQASLLPDELAGLLRAQRAYALGVLGAYGQPAAQRDRGALRTLRGNARRARASAEGALDRMRAEPARAAAGPLDRDRAVRMLAASRSFATGVLALHARAGSLGPAPVPGLSPLAEALDTTLTTLADAVAAHQPAPAAVAARLRPLHAELAATLGGESLVGALVVSETDLMVDSADSMAELLAAAPVARRRRRPLTRR